MRSRGTEGSQWRRAEELDELCRGDGRGRLSGAGWDQPVTKETLELSRTSDDKGHLELGGTRSEKGNLELGGTSSDKGDLELGGTSGDEGDLVLSGTSGDKGDFGK